MVYLLDTNILSEPTVATRNVDDFTPTGARVVNPYA